MTKINLKFSISSIPEARPRVLLTNWTGCKTAKIIVDIATISEKFTWNFVFQTPATQNCAYPTLIVHSTLIGQF
jgi:hypothetical protein